MNTDNSDPTDTKSPTQKLAELVARRKAEAAGKDWNGASGGRRASERAAAAHSTSRNKPALRKS